MLPRKMAPDAIRVIAKSTASNILEQVICGDFKSNNRYYASDFFVANLNATNTFIWKMYHNGVIDTNNYYSEISLIKLSYQHETSDCRIT